MASCSCTKYTRFPYGPFSHQRKARAKGVCSGRATGAEWPAAARPSRLQKDTQVLNVVSLREMENDDLLGPLVDSGDSDDELRFEPPRKKRARPGEGRRYARDKARREERKERKKRTFTRSELKECKRDFEERAMESVKKKLAKSGIPEVHHEAILLQRKLCIESGDVLPALPESEEAWLVQQAQNGEGPLYGEAMRRIECSRLSFLLQECCMGRLKGPVIFPLCYSQFYKHSNPERPCPSVGDALTIKSRRDLEGLMSTEEYVALVEKYSEHFQRPFLEDVARLGLDATHSRKPS